MTPWLIAEFTKHFPGISIHSEFTWHDRPHRVTALFGPSGCGKTTILRCLAGLERPDAGRIRFYDETWCDAARRIDVPPQRRRVGFLFQDYMLFPHLNVRDNIAFGASAQSSNTEIEQLLNRFQLTGMGDRRPRALSGGQKQRVALARVLAAQPRLLCLDEPLSALDGPTRIELRSALRDWLREVQLPALIVSHDPIEVQSLADDVIVLSEGQTRQAGSVAEVWQQPIDAAVARIVGFDNLLPVTVVEGQGTELQVTHQGWQLRGSTRTQLKAGTEAIACMRAEDLTLMPPLPQSGENHECVEASVVEMIPEGGLWRLRLKLPAGTILQAVASRTTVNALQPRPNDHLRVGIGPRAAVVVPR